MKRTQTTVIYNERVRVNILAAIKALPADGTIKVIIGPVQEKRTIAQNSLMWKWCTVFGEDVGYTKGEMHDVLCEEILGYRTFTDLRGNEKQTIQGTSGLNVKEMTDFLGHVERIAAEQGVLLPRPEDTYYRAMGFV